MRARLAELETQRKNFKQQIQKSYPEYFQLIQPKAVSPQDIARQLANDDIQFVQNAVQGVRGSIVENQQVQRGQPFEAVLVTAAVGDGAVAQFEREAHRRVPVDRREGEGAEGAGQHMQPAFVEQLDAWDLMHDMGMALPPVMISVSVVMTR